MEFLTPIKGGIPNWNGKELGGGGDDHWGAGKCMPGCPFGGGGLNTNISLNSGGGGRFVNGAALNIGGENGDLVNGDTEGGRFLFW